MIAAPSGMILTDQLQFVAYGLPAPQGSKRYVGQSKGGHAILVESAGERVHSWRDDVKHAALRALDGSPYWDRTCRIVTAEFTFVMPRPRHHYRTGANSHLLRDGAPHLHTHKPDIDKLLRSTADALTAAGVYPDDCCLARVSMVKVYADNTGAMDRPGVWVTLWQGVDE